MQLKSAGSPSINKVSMTSTALYSLTFFYIAILRDAFMSDIKYNLNIVLICAEGSSCKLENGTTGVCKKIYECPPRLREVIEGKRNSDSMGRCGFEDFTEIVCCQLNITEKIGLRPAETGDYVKAN